MNYPQQGYGITPSPQQPKKSWPRRHKVATVVLSIVAAFIVLTALGAALGSPSTGTPQAASGTTLPAAPAPVVTTPPASPAPPPPPAYTPQQQQAIDSATSYLSEGGGFSKAGLMGQLTSSYGEGFSHKLARFAIAHIQVNWMHQAVLSAKGYLSEGQGFSYAGLVSQLESPYGEQFSHAQAVHGATVALH